MSYNEYGEDIDMNDAPTGLDDVSAMQEEWRARQQAEIAVAQQTGPAPIIDSSIGRVAPAGFEQFSDQLHVYPGETAGETSAAGAGGYGRLNLTGREARSTPGVDPDNAIILDSIEDDDGYGEGEDEAPDPDDPRTQLGLQPKQARETLTEFRARIKVAAEKLGIQSKATLGDFNALGIDVENYASRKSAEQARQRIRTRDENEHRQKLDVRSPHYDELYAAEWRMDKANRQANNLTVKSNLLKEVREWQQRTGQPLEPAPDPDPDSGDELYSNEFVRGTRGGVLEALTVSATRLNDRGAPSAHGRDPRGPPSTSRCRRCMAVKKRCSLVTDGVRPCSRCREKGYSCLPGPSNHGYSPKSKVTYKYDGSMNTPRNPFSLGPSEPSMLDPPRERRRSRIPARRRLEGTNERPRGSRRSRQRSASPPFELDPTLRNAGRIPIRRRREQRFMGPNIHGALDPMTGEQVFRQAPADFNYTLNTLNNDANDFGTINPALLTQSSSATAGISPFAPAAGPLSFGNPVPAGAGFGAPSGTPPTGNNTYDPTALVPSHQYPPAGMMPPYDQHNQREINRRPEQEMQNASRTWNNDSIFPTGDGVDPNANDPQLLQEMNDFMDLDLDTILNDPSFSPVIANAARAAPAGVTADNVIDLTNSPNMGGFAAPANNNGAPQPELAEWRSSTEGVRPVPLDPLWAIPNLPPGGQTGARHRDNERARCSEKIQDLFLRKPVVCRKAPAKRCEFAMAHPDNPEGHRDMMGQFKYLVCEDCWTNNQAECKDYETETIKLTKSYTCTPCAFNLQGENKVVFGKCTCIDKLTNSWVCKEHLKHGFEKIRENGALKSAFLLEHYGGTEPCVRCYAAHPDVASGVYACRNCQVFVKDR